MQRRLVVLGALIAVVLSSARAPRRPPAAPPPPPAPPVAHGPIEVVIRPASPPSNHRWGVEAAGHVAVLVEAGLAEARGVVPRIPGAPPPPGLADALPAAAPTWGVTLQVGLNGDVLGLVATLCDPDQACTTHGAVGDRLRPHVAVASVVRDVAERLGRPLVGAPPAGSETADDYAALLLGRAAATVAGLRAPTPPEHLGDPRRDAVARAVFLDPAMGTAQALLVRSVPEPARQVQAARLAVQAQPWSVARAADLAAALGRVALADQAHDAWQGVAARAPGDVRFVLPRARAALALGEPALARRILDELQGVDGRPEPARVRLEVEVADRLGGAADELLARWQEIAPHDPEPVRRRIALRVDRDALDDALALTDLLALRGASHEAGALKVALASDLGRLEVAARTASELGAGELARRLEAAGAGPERTVEILADAVSPEARLARARALLALGRADEAVDDVTALLDAEPWWPEALAVAARAWEALGEGERAADARARLRHADPLHPEGGA